MHETEQDIISLFRKENKELATSEILASILPEYQELKKQFSSRDRDIIKKAKHEIAKLHRRVLHHINKLLDMEILKQTKHGARGEKFFSLNIADNEEIILPGVKKRIVISKAAIPSMPIEGYEQKGIILKYEPATFIDRLNSAIIRCENISRDKLSQILTETIFPSINDAVCLENFECLIDKNLTEFIKKVNSEAEDYGKKINFSINLQNLKNKEAFLSFLDSLGSIERKELGNLFFIFSINSQQINENFEIFRKIIELFSRKRINLYIKNNLLNSAPQFLGRAGPYCIDKKEWAEEEIKNHVCVACSQSSMILDFNKFYLENGINTEKFSEVALNMAKSLLASNSLQRRSSEEYFKRIISLNYKKEFLQISKNYIRFWNYGLSQKGIEPETVLNVISEAKKKTDGFARAEETMYNSCGMPTRFKVAFSCAFKEADEKLSQAAYEHLEIKSFEDLYKSKVKKELKNREIISEIFNGGNDVTFHKTGTLNPEEVVREISVILNTFKLPFFSYNFEKIKGDLRIIDFLK